MKIIVTQKNIDEGIRHSGCECPIALACNSVGLSEITVGIQHIFGLGFHRKFKLPNEAIGFINSFDLGHKVKPFSFEAEEIDPNNYED